jgi:hypothetical protein
MKIEIEQIDLKNFDRSSRVSGAIFAESTRCRRRSGARKASIDCARFDFSLVATIISPNEACAL